MSATAAPSVSLLGFGGLDGRWGVALLGPDPRLVLGPAADGEAPETVALSAGSPDALCGDRVDLRLEHGPAPLCRLTGELAGDGGLTRLGAEAAIELAEIPSLAAVRVVLAWFAPDDGFALTTARPRGARGQEDDAVTMAMHEPGGPIAIDEGRLSTTYARTGEPRRMSVEAWPQDDENAYPHRSAGEVVGAAAEIALGSVVLGIHPLRCHRAGRDGAGLYVIGRGR